MHDSVPLNRLCFAFPGTAGLLMAYSLLQSSKETDVCIFEKENRLGGKIFDHRFPDAPKVTVGKFSVLFCPVNRVEISARLPEKVFSKRRLQLHEESFSPG